MKLAIVAGGKGTRLGLSDIPKPMVQICGKPLLEHQINLAAQFGIKDIFCLSGHLSDAIVDYFGDGSAFGVNITHIVEDKPLGTAGSIRQLKGMINDRFMVFYGDVIFDIDVGAFMEFDNAYNSIANIIVHPNDHPHDSDLLDMDDNGVVTAFYPKPHYNGKYYRNLVNAAVYILDPRIFKYIPVDRPSDFGKDIFPLLLKSNETIRAYKTAEYLKDLGTSDRLKKVTDDFSCGKIARFSKRNKRPAIFIDRDGTLIEDVDLLVKTGDLKLFPFAGSAIRKINGSDFLSFLITNQPVVARNLCDIQAVKQIHNKLEWLLGKEEAYLNDIYFCPHHPDKGYPEENPNYKIECICRKPNTGMIDQAVKEYNIDVARSWMIGDATVDIETAKNAGLKSILVRTGKGGMDNKYDADPDFIFQNLDDAVSFILSIGEGE